MADKTIPSQQELIALSYNRKLESLARASAERMGRPYGTTEPDWDQLVVEWDTKDPAVDEQQVWERVLTKAVQATVDDPTLDRDEVLREVPIEVARIVYPAREELIKSSGGTSYAEWADFADKLEERAARTRDARQAAEREQLGLMALPAPAPESAPAPLPDPALSTPEPIAPEPLPAPDPMMAAALPTAAAPAA